MNRDKHAVLKFRKGLSGLPGGWSSDRQKEERKEDAEK